MKSLFSRVLLLVLSLSVFSSCYGGAVKGSVSCLDCHAHHDLSGIRVRVKCKDDARVATTVSSGAYEVNLPETPSSSGCAAELLGGPARLYGFKKSMRVEVANSEAVSNLQVYTRCPLSDETKCESSSSKWVGKGVIGSRKTVDLPLPREWGLAPSSYYINPFIPIIGIP